jgi:hypothetical protein
MKTIGTPTPTNLGTMRHEVTEYGNRVTLDVTDVGAVGADIAIRAINRNVFGQASFEASVSMGLERPAELRALAAHLCAIADRLDAANERDR